MSRIDIRGIDKAELLAALYNNTRVFGIGVLHEAPLLTVEQARGIIAERINLDRLVFDYVAGRPIKADISGDDFDPRLYDRDAGEGRAAQVVADLRKSLGR